MLKPIFEIVDEREFTDREEELAFLWRQVERARERRGSSYAIIARKGMGKTALLERFYNQLFIQQDEVIPFYVSFAEFKGFGKTSLTIRQFMRYYLRTLVAQYLAFHLRDSDMARFAPGMEELLTILQEQRPQVPAAGAIERYLNYVLEATAETYRDYLPDIIQFTRRALGVGGRAPGILMIDEFQVLTDVLDEKTGERANITELFQKTAEVKWCPMVVTGSAVSLITRTVMGGLLARRFGPYHLEPFDLEHSVECALKLARLDHVPLHEGVAYGIHTLTGGNPHYIWCLLNSESLTETGLTSFEQLYRVYEYEMNDPDGKLRGFWDVHFSTMARRVNAQGDGLRLLYHLATHPASEFNIHDMAAYFQRDLSAIEEIMAMLEQADLVEWLVKGGICRRITDPVLADYIVRRYRTLLERESFASYLETFETDYRRKMGSLSNAVGHAAELFTIGLLTRFGGQEVDGRACFGVEGKVTLPRFDSVVNRSGSIVAGDHIEFDVVCEGEETWLVEVRHRQRPLGPRAVEQFWRKVEQWEGERPVAWLLSFSGFTAPAVERLVELGLRHGDRNSFDRLADAVGYVHFPPRVTAPGE